MSTPTFERFASAYCKITGADPLSVAQMYQYAIGGNADESGLLEFVTGVMEDMTQPNKSLNADPKGRGDNSEVER